MAETPFYKEHWTVIDDERLDRYQRMFEWNPGSAELYRPADIQPGHIVVELGCGPGHTAIEIAKWVGPDGVVHALDINEAFVKQTRQNVIRAGVQDRVVARVSDGSDLPFSDGTIDRITARNTLIYVDDPTVTVGTFKRVLRPGGKAHAIEGDWPMMVAEPVPTATWRAFVSAASRACRTPDIGRRLSGLLARSNFQDVDVQVMTRPDVDGRLLPMITTMAGYARGSGDIAEAKIDLVLSTLRHALRDKTYLVVAPQFVVTGTC